MVLFRLIYLERLDPEKFKITSPHQKWMDGLLIFLVMLLPSFSPRILYPLTLFVTSQSLGLLVPIYRTKHIFAAKALWVLDIIFYFISFAWMLRVYAEHTRRRQRRV
jgi:hypothetical protein